MDRLFLCSFLCFLIMPFALKAAVVKTPYQSYVSPNHQLRAVIKNQQSAKEIMPESIVVIYDARGKLLARKSYVSVDHEHGFSVVQLKWSVDSKFCVWSLTSSGGHSPWHFPTDCFISKCKAIVNVDEQLDCGLTRAKFRLRKPHLLISQRLIPNPQGEPQYTKVIFDLTKLKCH